jgi:hypothetical protein
MTRHDAERHAERPKQRHDEPLDLRGRTTHGWPDDPLMDLLDVPQTRDEIQAAVKRVRSETVDLEGVTVPAVPSAADARLLLEAQDLPVTVGARRIERLRVQRGQPRHGAMPSGSHVDRFRVVWHVATEDCPECDRRRRVRDMNRHGNEAVRDAVLCDHCSHEYAAVEF